jgi:LysM repeat protein
MTKRSKAPARAFAVLALIGGFVVLVVVFSAALSGGESDDGRQGGSPGNVSRQQTPDKETPKVYVIENGDTLTAIAHETGVPVATIQRLNPEVDPQILISGEKLKLR